MVLPVVQMIPAHTFLDIIFLKLSFFLKSNIINVFEWSHRNGLIVNSNKSHFLISPYRHVKLKKF